VSTDCPHGPDEVLVNPRLGVLTPVEDPLRLAEAMVEVGSRPADHESGPAHVRDHHSPAVAGEAYLRALLPSGSE
jgi:hypothetical protein